MAISFPSNPIVGDTYTAAGKTWTWNGAQWEGIPAAAGIPSGETADRPSTPSIGDQFYNGTLGVLEIYTSSGWLPATGANDFNVVLNGEDTSVVLDKEYFSGAYTITSALNDTSFDLYLFDTQGATAGYTRTPSINATNNFNKVVVLGGTAGDLLSFSYKTTFTTAPATSELGAGPLIKSISVADLPNIDDTTVITGINFAEDVQVTFTGTNSVAISAKSIVRSSATSLIVTRPDTLIQDYSPYTVTVTNPGVTSPTGTNGHIFTNAITAGGDPTWVTPAGALATAAGPYSVSLQANDPDGGQILYSVVTGQLPAGLSLNSSTGVISGTATIAESKTFTVAATDLGGNITNRSFSIAVTVATGGTITDISGYRVHTFTSSGTFTALASIGSLEYLVVAGGGGGGGRIGGGGGAGGLLTGSTSISSGAYAITVGGGGAGGSGQSAGQNGQNSNFNSITAIGGGGGATTDGFVGNSGGSGGGGGRWTGGQFGPGTGGAGTAGQGNSGGQGTPQMNNPDRSGGGGGAGGAGASGQASGNGGAGILSSISGTSLAYAGGGGGAGHSGAAGGAGGSEVGGNGESGTSGGSNATPANRGSGGGGGGYTGEPGRNGFNGSSGIVIVRYAI